MDWRFKGLVDICAGRMTLKDVNREIIHYMISVRKPQRLIVDIQRKEDGYHATIWITKKDFHKKVKCVRCKKETENGFCQDCFELMAEISMI